MVTPSAHYEPQGIILPAKIVRAPTSADDVVIYHQAPFGVKDLGQIRVEFAFKTLNTQVRDDLLAKVKALAASVGANGVVVNVLVPGEGVRQVLSFVGTAVYVSGSKKQ
ncbi:MAG: hypothetical protein Q8L78_06480 [Coxiellaceae bacterium]|nr:hypothetical protein [Coxiellaceae bacterium]